MAGRRRQIEFVAHLVETEVGRLLVKVFAQAVAKTQRDAVERTVTRDHRLVVKTVHAAVGLERLRRKIVIKADLVFALPEIAVLHGGIHAQQRCARR